MTTDPLKTLLSLENQEDGPALPLSHGAARHIVEGAMARFYDGGEPAASALSTARWGRAVAVSGVLGLVLGALAFGIIVARSPGRPATRDVGDDVRGEGVRAVDSSAGIAVAPPALGDAVIAADRTPASPVTGAKNALSVPGERPHIAGERAPKGGKSKPTVGDAIVVSDLELLGAANAARGARRFRDADALYTKVIERFPGSPVSTVAALASGELRLEVLGDAEGARSRFRFAIARGGEHAVDAYDGLIKACAVLGDTRGQDDARAALDDHLRQKK